MKVTVEITRQAARARALAEDGTLLLDKTEEWELLDGGMCRWQLRKPNQEGTHCFTGFGIELHSYPSGQFSDYTRMEGGGVQIGLSIRTPDDVPPTGQELLDEARRVLATDSMDPYHHTLMRHLLRLAEVMPDAVVSPTDPVSSLPRSPRTGPLNPDS